MKSKDFLLKLSPTWHATITDIALRSHLTMSQVMRNALQRDLNLPDDFVQTTYRARAIPKKSTVHRLTPSKASRASLSVDLPRWMDIVVKAVAKQQNQSISTLVCMLIRKDLKCMPSEEVPTPFTETMVKRIPLSEASGKYHLRASIPSDWMPVLKEYAENNGQKVGVVVSNILIKRLGMLKESVIRQHEVEIAQANSYQLQRNQHETT